MKFSTRSRGPLKVVRQVARSTFRLQNLVTGLSEEYSRQDLVPYDIDTERYSPRQVAQSDKFLLETEKVISHTPRSPKTASQLSFVVQWTGYEGEDEHTVEKWADSKTLHKSRVVTRYLEEKGLTRFTPKSIVYSSDSEESSV